MEKLWLSILDKIVVRSEILSSDVLECQIKLISILNLQIKTPKQTPFIFCV